MPENLKIICEYEISKMKTIMTANFPPETLYDFLFLKKHRFLRYVANENHRKILIQCYHDFIKVFPSYGRLLNYRFLYVKNLNKLYFDGNLSLFKMIEKKLFPCCERKILKYLSDEDFKNLVESTQFIPSD